MPNTKFNFTRLFTTIAIVAVVVLIFSSLISNAQAVTGINRQINFQGKLVNNPTSTNVNDTSYTVIFTFYDAPSGGTALWTETQTVTTKDGIFRVALGSITPFPANFNFNWSGLYLGIKVNADAEMTPRIQMSAVPFAFNSEKVAGLTVQDTSGNASTSGTLQIANAKTFNLGNNNLTFTTSGDTTLTLPTSGTVTALGNTTTGSGSTLVLNSNPSFVGITLTSGAITLGGSTGGGQCITGGATASWGSCGGGVSYWDLSLGALLPKYATVNDLLVGGNSTSSALFSFTGVSNLNHQTIASISGNLIVEANNGYGGNVGIGTATPNDKLTIRGSNSEATLGSEKITSSNDRDFTTNTGNWTGSPPWKIDVANSNKAVKDAPGQDPLVLSNTALNSAPIVNHIYQITFDFTATATSSGYLYLGIGGGSAYGSFGGPGESGSQVVVIPAFTTDPLYFTTDTNWFGTIDNVSIKEITPTNSLLTLLNSNGSQQGVEIRSGGSSLYNTFVGYQSGISNISGVNNNGFGGSSLGSNTIGNRNNAFGDSSLYSNTTGSYNNAFGESALATNTIGDGNNAFGYQALYANSSGTNNSAFGFQALTDNTTGSQNDAFGFFSLASNTTGLGNVGFGSNSLWSNIVGSNNTALGNSALFLNTSGWRNTSVGYESLKNTTEGSNNTALGFQAGLTNTNGSLNTYLGYNANGNFGDHINTTAIGANAYVTRSNSLVLGSINGINGASASAKVGIGTTAPDFPLTVSNSDQAGTVGYFESLVTTGNNYGVESEVYGVGAIKNVAGYFDAQGATTNYGLEINVQPGANNFAIYTENGSKSYFSGNVGIGVDPTYALDVVGDINWTGALRVGGLAGNSGECLKSAAGGANTWGTCGSGGGTNWWNQVGGLVYPTDTGYDFAVGSTATSSALFSYTGIKSGHTVASVSGNLVVEPNNGYGGQILLGGGRASDIDTLAANTLSIGTTNTTAITIGGVANTLTLGSVTYLSQYGGNNAILFADSGTQIEQRTTSTEGQCLLSGLVDPLWGTCPDVPNWWNQVGGLVYPTDSGYDFAVGGTATTSALFSYTGVKTGNTQASVSGKLIIMPNNGYGNVGIGTTDPTAPLSFAVPSGGVSINNTISGSGLVLSAGALSNSIVAQLRIVGNGNGWLDAQDTAYFQAQTNTANNLTFLSGGYGTDAVFNRLQFDSNFTTIADNLHTLTPVPTSLLELINNTTTKGILKLRGSSGQIANYLDINSFGGTGGDILAVSGSGRVGIGALYPLATLDVRGASISAGTIPVASISGKTSNATLVVNNDGVGDLIAASQSGWTRFTVKNDGTVDTQGSASIGSTLQFKTNGGGTIQASSNQGLTFGGGSTGQITFSPNNGTGKVVIGSITNGLVYDIANGGTTYFGTGRPSKTIVLYPEYAGAVLTASGSATITGTMTSDASPSASFRNYYEWSSTQDVPQNYYVAVRVALPSDFSAWQTGTTAMQIAYNTDSNNITANKVDIYIYDPTFSASVPVVYHQGLKSTTWASDSISNTELASWATAGETATIYLKMTASGTYNKARIGGITLNYLAKF